jgi:nucleoside-diphosphate-sugar epimerase
MKRIFMHIFIIGATGHIGGKVAQRALAAGHQVTGFARNEAGVEKLRGQGIAPLLGAIDDLPPLVAQAKAADVTIFAPQVTPDEEHAAVSAIVEGLRGTGKTFIFTSGTGVLGQRTGGIWDENAWAEDDDIPFSKLVVRRVETERLVQASAATGVRGLVLRPAAVWGDGYHSIAERLLSSYVKTGAVCYIGEGTNCYSAVNIDDLVDLYMLAMEKGVAGALYHAASGEVNNRCIAELLAIRLNCETRSVSMDEAIEIWGKFSTLIVLSVSSRTRAPRSRRELGWSPSRHDVVGAILHGPLNPG